MLALFFIGAIVTYFMLPYDWFMEIIGFLATFIEAMLGKWKVDGEKKPEISWAIQLKKIDENH